MEEAIYKRQIAKISMSKRIIDEQQINRQFNRADLIQLYSTENILPKPTFQSNAEVPGDVILAKQLIKHRDSIHDWHCHDSLLQNNEDENLSPEEMQQAWAEFESEKTDEKFQNSLKLRGLELSKCNN